ncbi:MAG: gamma-glutamyltransferase [Candidatus Riflebacteria bacterium]|nr:gamma-glutamyltransferase [Candidatus Riflebacteria bacterium]
MISTFAQWKLFLSDKLKQSAITRIMYFQAGIRKRQSKTHRQSVGFSLLPACIDKSAAKEIILMTEMFRKITLILCFPTALMAYPVRPVSIRSSDEFTHFIGRLLLVILLISISFTQPLVAQERQIVASGSFGAIATGHPRATAAALSILERGGNAVDAAVAAAFVLGVVDLSNSGPGGEGFALVRLPGGKIESWNGTIRRPRSGLIGSSSIGLPTEVALLLSLHERHGNRCLTELLSPAIKLAREGFQVTGYLETVLAKGIFRFRDPEAIALFAPGGRPVRAGEKFIQPALADTLASIAADHGASFYNGELAGRISRDIKARGSAYTSDDLAAYRPGCEFPVTLDIGPWRLVGVPPPSCSVVVMGMVRQLLASSWNPNTTEGLAEWLDIARRYLRLKRIELPKCIRNPRRFFVAASLSGPQTKIGRDLESDPDPDEMGGQSSPSTVPDDLNPSNEPLQENTTHLVVWDKNGMIVSMTLTLGLHFGAAEFSPLGFFYSNQMRHYTNFSSRYPRDYPIDAGPISSKAPLLVLRNGKPFLAIGGAGNNRIITNTAAVTSAVLSGNQSLAEAVNAPRAFPEAKNTTVIEWRPELRKTLAALKMAGLLTGGTRNKPELTGRKVDVKPAGDDYFGLVSAVCANNNDNSASSTVTSEAGLIAVGDYRRDGSSAAVFRDPAEHRDSRFEIPAWQKNNFNESSTQEVPHVAP